MADQSAASYSVEALANTILDSAERQGKEIGPMKLQKLMYLAHGYYLARTGKPLIDEFFEAWQYGPVVPTIYQLFKRFGSGTIKKGFRISHRGYSDFFPDEECEKPTIPEDDKDFWKILHFIIERYGDKSAIYLSDLTHKVGSPWALTKERYPSMRSADIQNSLIETYFKKFV